MRPRHFIEKLRHDAIVSAIREAERKTSGEIRVFISHKPIADPVPAAEAQFMRMGMTHTRHRNGVLIFVAPRSHNFAVIGDSAVHARCGDPFWQSLVAEMAHHFKDRHFNRGLLHAIKKAGDLLSEHFPPEPDNPNELSDDVQTD